MRVAVKELKSGLSRILARAQAGEVFEVTCHNRPVARIVGVPSFADERWNRLIADGTISWNGGKPRIDTPLQLAANNNTPVSGIVMEDRG